MRPGVSEAWSHRRRGAFDDVGRAYSETAARGAAMGLLSAADSGFVAWTARGRVRLDAARDVRDGPLQRPDEPRRGRVRRQWRGSGMACR
jgi:hypothetical protein